MKNTTLCFCVNKEEGIILLAMKKRGFGVGKWNGPGGKVESNETIEEAAIRECREETGIEPIHMQFCGINTFIFETKPEWSNKCHMFISNKWKGEMEETDEMRPQWFKISDIPFSSMWPDDAIWYPEILKGEVVHYNFYFSEDGALIKYEKFDSNPL